MSIVFRGAAGACLLMGAALAASAWQEPGGAVFTATNGVNRNEIVMYKRAPNGALHLAGRFPTGGRGEGGVNDPLQSQNSVILSPDHQYLLAVNAGTSDISVFRVSEYGLLLMSVTPSRGGNPISLAMHDDLVYVVNFGGGYHTAGFRLQPWGGLTPIRNSRQPLSTLDTGASTVAFSPNGSKLVVSERIASKIDVFDVKDDGSLANPVYNQSAGREPFGLQFTPDGVLLVTEATFGPPNAGTISSYEIQPDNKLTTISASASASGTATCWLTTNGLYAWVSDTGSNNIGALKIAPGGELTSLGSVAQVPASFPLDSALAGDGHYLVILYSNVGQIVSYRIGENGALKEVSSVSGVKPSSGAEGLAAY